MTERWDAENTRIAVYRSTMPRSHRWLCRLRIHRPMPDPIRSGTLVRIGHVDRFECYCGRAYWLEDLLGRVRM